MLEYKNILSKFKIIITSALPDLKKLNLEEAYTKLSKMLKNNVSGYKDNNTLENTIAKYKEAIIKRLLRLRVKLK